MLNKSDDEKIGDNRNSILKKKPEKIPFLQLEATKKSLFGKQTKRQVILRIRKQQLKYQGHIIKLEGFGLLILTG